MYLRSKPLRPRYLPGANAANLVWDEGMPETWKDYMRSMRYWNDPLED